MRLRGARVALRCKRVLLAGSVFCCCVAEPAQRGCLPHLRPVWGHTKRMFGMREAERQQESEGSVRGGATAASCSATSSGGRSRCRPLASTEVCRKYQQDVSPRWLGRRAQRRGRPGRRWSDHQSAADQTARAGPGLPRQPEGMPELPLWTADVGYCCAPWRCCGAESGSVVAVRCCSSGRDQQGKRIQLRLLCERFYSPPIFGG